MPGFYKKKDLPMLKESLVEAKARLKDVQERGDDAISEYDLSMGYDANFYLNTCPLLQNHVTFYTNEIAILEKHGVQLKLF